MTWRKIQMTEDRRQLLDLIDAGKVQRRGGPHGHIGYHTAERLLDAAGRESVGGNVTKRVRTLMHQEWVRDIGGTLVLTDAGRNARNGSEEG